MEVAGSLLFERGGLSDDAMEAVAYAYMQKRPRKATWDNEYNTDRESLDLSLGHVGNDCDLSLRAMCTQLCDISEAERGNALSHSRRDVGTVSHSCGITPSDCQIAECNENHNALDRKVKQGKKEKFIFINHEDYFNTYKKLLCTHGNVARCGYTIKTEFIKGTIHIISKINNIIGTSRIAFLSAAPRFSLMSREMKHYMDKYQQVIGIVPIAYGGVRHVLAMIVDMQSNEVLLYDDNTSRSAHRRQQYASTIKPITSAVSDSVQWVNPFGAEKSDPGFCGIHSLLVVYVQWLYGDKHRPVAERIGRLSHQTSRSIVLIAMTMRCARLLDSNARVSMETLQSVFEAIVLVVECQETEAEETPMEFISLCIDLEERINIRKKKRRKWSAT